MSLASIYNTISLISPYVEVGLRHLYWHNIRYLKKFNPHKPKKAVTCNYVDFDKILDWLKGNGIGEGDLLVVHSGYGELECTGLSADDIIDRLLKLVGSTGTIAMPVIRRYKNIEKAKKDKIDLQNHIFSYNVKKTMVISGMLPFTLMQREGAVISHHPFNPLCALGPHAKPMMEHNLDGDYPSPHGPNSSWKYCFDHNVKICSIGTDIEHHITIGHVVEESLCDWPWNDNQWYDKYTFEIIDEFKNKKVVGVKNRKDEWGKLHLAENHFCDYITKNGALVSDNIDGIEVGFVNPQKMASLLCAVNHKGYPYYLFPWEKRNICK